MLYWITAARFYTHQAARASPAPQAAPPFGIAGALVLSSASLAPFSLPAMHKSAKPSVHNLSRLPDDKDDRSIHTADSSSASHSSCRIPRPTQLLISLYSQPENLFGRLEVSPPYSSSCHISGCP
ncbi:hypothetical protein PtB15_8B3 [Puccinia triticina]|nr:hypothetical protein PtB15_8B3 [Puccinia triticina]